MSAPMLRNLFDAFVWLLGLFGYRGALPFDAWNTPRIHVANTTFVGTANWAPCSTGPCCNPHLPPQSTQYCPGHIKCQECGGGDACQCPTGPGPSPPSPPSPSPTPMPPTPSGSMDDLPDSSVMLINDGKDQLTVYVEYANEALEPPLTPWTKLSGGGNLAQPEKYGPQGVHPANDVGAATWQLVTLPPGQSIVLQIPEFPRPQAWSLRPLKYIDGKPCSGGGGDCGMPILVESGKNMVGDMSAVDGVNYNLKYEMTAKDGVTTIDFKSNPCKAINAPSSKGCRNPQIDVPQWLDPPCPAGTCHNQGLSKTWCDTIHEGQCANSASTWTDRGIGFKDCAPKNQFTTYCYSHDDANSSPWFAAPYKMRLTYSDLDAFSELVV